MYSARHCSTQVSGSRTAHIRRQATAPAHTQRTRTTQRKHFTGCSLWGRPTHAARSRALSAPSTAVACGRPRRGAVAALVPRWSHDDDHLPGGRVTRALPPPAKGHGRGAWCKRRNRTAGGRWGPHLPGQPASRLHPHALVRAAFDNAGSDRHGLWVRHADTHAQSNTPFALNRPRRSARHGRDSRRLARSPGRVDRSCRSSGPLVQVQWTARGGRVDRSQRSSRPLQGASGPRGSGEWESFKGRLDATRTVEWPDGRSTRSPHSTLPLWRGALSRGRLAAASGPPPRASRPLATTVRAATSSAGPSYLRKKKKVFPVEHFGVDLRGESGSPCAPPGPFFSSGAAARRGGAPPIGGEPMPVQVCFGPLMGTRDQTYAIF